MFLLDYGSHTNHKQASEKQISNSFHLLYYQDELTGGSVSDKHRDELLEKIGCLSAYIRIRWGREAHEEAPPKSRDTLAIANFKNLKAMLSGVENLKNQVKALHNTSDSIQLKICALRGSNKGSASYILASNEAILSAIVRLLPPCDLCPSANFW